MLLLFYVTILTTTTLHYHFIDFDHLCEHLDEAPADGSNEDIVLLSDHFPVCQTQQFFSSNLFCDLSESEVQSAQSQTDYFRSNEFVAIPSDQNQNALRRGPPVKFLS